MMVLVTGASGFVGKRLCELLEAKGYDVVRVGHQTNSLRYVDVGGIGPTTDWTQVFGNPVPDSQSLSPVCTGINRIGSIDAIVHLAARVHVMREQAAEPLAEFRRVNVGGTLNLARQAAQAGVRRFIFLSSIKVNGEETDNAGSAERRDLSAEGRKAFREDDVLAPEDVYGISKWEAEQGLMEIAGQTGMEVVIIRPPLVYGPGVKGNFLTMLRWLEKGLPLPLGSIQNKRSLLALDNLVDFIMVCLDHPAAANQTFLVADGEDLSTTELLRRTSAALGRTARLLPIPQAILQSGLKLMGKGDWALRLCGSLQVDISKARTLLGWKPPISVDEGLRRTVRHSGQTTFNRTTP